MSGKGRPSLIGDPGTVAALRLAGVVVLATDADVAAVAAAAAVTFQSRDSFVEFVVDQLNDVSFSFLPIADSRQPPPPPAAAAGVSSAASAAEIILLAFGGSHDRALSVYIGHSNDDDDDDDDDAERRLVVERRLQTSTDRLSISLARTQATAIHPMSQQFQLVQISFTNPSVRASLISTVLLPPSDRLRLRLKPRA